MSDRAPHAYTYDAEGNALTVSGASTESTYDYTGKGVNYFRSLPFGDALAQNPECPNQSADRNNFHFAGLEHDGDNTDRAQFREILQRGRPRMSMGPNTGSYYVSNPQTLMSITPVDRPAGSSVKFLDITFMAANAVGVVLYLVLASHGWRIPQERGMIPVSGEPFVWALALPVLGAFLLADIVWGALLLRDREHKRGLWWFATAAGWLLAIGIDFSHH